MDSISYTSSHPLKRKNSQSLELAGERRPKQKLGFTEPASSSTEVYDSEFCAAGPREELLWQNDVIRGDLDILHSRIHELQQELQRLDRDTLDAKIMP